MSRYLVPVYAITIFLSAFLLFVFQPMVGKYLLPSLGGTPSVWNTAMLFFQILLLAGYIYAHLLSKIENPKIQAILHVILMALAALTLPLTLPADTGISSEQPVIWQLRTMIGMAAGPFFILSASAPLLQKWFSRTNHKNADNPYFLYSASNIGSMLALLSYPFVTEPLLTLHEQSNVWSVGYFLLAGLFALCFFSAKFQPEVKIIDNEKPITLQRKLLWIFLAFCPSSLMLGYTTYITTDVASMPLFWVIPLALYLGTFIIAFSAKPSLPLPVTRILHGILAVLMLFFLITQVLANKQITSMVFHGALFFFTALLCHQELVALKPRTSKLTEFYLYISLGGALGGAFNSLLAPFIFKLPYEYYLVMILALAARYASDKYKAEKTKYDWWNYALFPGIMVLGAGVALFGNFIIHLILGLIISIMCFGLIEKRFAFFLTALIIVLFNPPYSWSKIRDSLYIERNFFGVLRIEDHQATGERVLNNGTTNHGSQAIDQNFKKIPLTYYHPAGAAGDIFANLDGFAGEQKVAALGLGVGSIACYQYTGRSFDFYEINPEVIKLADEGKYFTYLKDCKSQYKIMLGDARQEIAKAPDGSYDLIFVDVFSSDNIPLHVMTLEALETYKKKLKSDGMIVIHISNRFFDLQSEVTSLGDKIGWPVLYKYTSGGSVLGTKIKYNPTVYTVLSPNKLLMDKFRQQGWIKKEIPADMRPWTDDYANIIRAFK